jgi:hypothetical protein
MESFMHARNADDVYVIAIMHFKREPDYWLGRLRDLPPPPD